MSPVTNHASNQAPNARHTLLHQELTERIASLRVRASRAVDGIRSGMHKSPHRGASVIFAEHRDYRPGDDLRMLDWRAYARNDRYTIKHFEQETHLRANLLLDLSASMAFDGGQADTHKATYAATVLAAFGWILLGQGDAVGAFAFDTDLRNALPARNRPDHLEALLSVLALPVAHDRFAPKPSHLASSLTALSERVGRRGLVVLASDLIDTEPDALAPLSRLTALGHDVMVLHIMHPQELDFPFKHGLHFEDAESPASLEADADAVRAAYLAELASFLTQCKQRCLSAGARYTLARTDRPVEDVLAGVLLSARRTGWG
ncbi:MAG: hypothetical protein RL701_7600 [Pseudomonadota bacterium]